ncbi:MAG TPA: LTA synthase family protein, partial [Stenotrophomonas sp.]|nr:LTA synthase family protein [Stenotrophomonas sp.]
YPKEVGATLLRGHLASVLAGVLVVGGLVWILLRSTRRWIDPPPIAAALGWPWRLGTALVVLLAATLGVRSSLGHRPLNPAAVAFSTDPTVNVLPLNSLYSVAHAARDLAKRSETARIYGAMTLAEVVQELRASSGLPASAYLSRALPTLTVRPPAYRGKPRNLVVILEESLGAQFIGSLGGLPLSPHYDRLSAQGWALERLYATGTRSVRGIEAVVSGFPPTPAEAVVKLPATRTRFFTLADLLARHGYDTAFYYGGESHFDNMRGFFLGSGFQRIVDRDDFARPDFVGSWGVSDEDLFALADQQFRQLSAQGKPFFGLVFSSSNHDPFEFPDGRIQLHEQPKQTRNNAAKYADHALGKFFAKAMASPYWRDTVFLVVADHDSRVFGQDLVPIGNFHIPGLILGGGIAPRRDTRIASQIDLAPTVLSLMGIAGPTPMLGQDLNDPHRLVPGRAMMQYDRNLAWMEGQDVAILQPGKAPLGFRYDPSGNRLRPHPLRPELARRALAHALWGTLAYEQELHRLPP